MEGSVESKPNQVAGDAGKYLTFTLGAETYGLEILVVREIIGLMDVTPVPRTPRYIRGVINLRGRIIPVVDLRTKFGLPPATDTPETCIIVVDIPDGESSLQMSVVVDTVSEVLDISGEAIEEPPSIGAGECRSFIRGIARNELGIKVLLDMREVLRADGLVPISETLEKSIA
ncbi:MAG: purine-binding chemotaxis protein CheW [Calditrichaeota bacterium]|nr:purine-binding chemotaxis protein CheW [Candidatus Cloacimonadota bacterium]MCB1046124.1 purine-binding chemotaxis protein CheW [Calditrichota bacterium]